MSLLPPSLGGGGGFVSCVGTQCVTHCTPVQSVQTVTNTQVFKLLIKISLLAPIIAMASLNNST